MVSIRLWYSTTNYNAYLPKALFVHHLMIQSQRHDGSCDLKRRAGVAETFASFGEQDINLVCVQMVLVTRSSYRSQISRNQRVRSRRPHEHLVRVCGSIALQL